MPINNEKVLKKIVENFDDLPIESIKDFLQRYIQKAYYYEAIPMPHSKKKLKNGTEKTYYMFPIPNEAFKYSKIDPNQKYRIELYPIEKVKKEKEDDKKENG